MSLGLRVRRSRQESTEQCMSIYSRRAKPYSRWDHGHETAAVGAANATGVDPTRPSDTAARVRSPMRPWRVGSSPPHPLMPPRRSPAHHSFLDPPPVGSHSPRGCVRPVIMIPVRVNFDAAVMAVGGV